jgi:hypothetical protein
LESDVLWVRASESRVGDFNVGFKRLYVRLMFKPGSSPRSFLVLVFRFVLVFERGRDILANPQKSESISVVVYELRWNARCLRIVIANRLSWLSSSLDYTTQPATAMLRRRDKHMCK